MAGLFDLSGRVALVTGAYRGLGFSIARGLATAGATVILNGRKPDELASAGVIESHERDGMRWYSVRDRAPRIRLSSV